MAAPPRARLWENLRALADNGTGILVTTHYMQEAAQCDRLVMLAAGKVTGTGTVDEITAGHSSLVVSAKRWEEAFKLLQDAGIPALLDGRTLRLPGAGRGHPSGCHQGAGPYQLVGNKRLRSGGRQAQGTGDQPGGRQSPVACHSWA